MSFKEILASKNIRWWKHWPDSQQMETFEVKNVATLRCQQGVRVCVCVFMCVCSAVFLYFHDNEMNERSFFSSSHIFIVTNWWVCCTSVSVQVDL